MGKLKIPVKKLRSHFNTFTFSFNDRENFLNGVPEKINFRINPEYKHIVEKNLDFYTPRLRMDDIMNATNLSDDCYVILNQSQTTILFEAAEKYNHGRMIQVNLNHYAI